MSRINKKLESVETGGITLDHAAAIYDIAVPIMMLGTHNIHFKRATKLLEIKPTDKILDIGCGTGALQPYILKHLNPSMGGKVVGIDAAGKMIEKAIQKRGQEGIEFEVAAAENLPFDDSYFDKATSLFFFHHVNYELKLKAAHEIYRVLKPGATFILIDVSRPTNWLGRVCMNCGEWLFNQPEIGENRDGKHILALETAGFETLRTTGDWLGYVSTYTMRKPI